MVYSKKPLFLFSTVALSISVVAGFFIRQKILNDSEIAEFNALLKQIQELEIEIKKDEQDLENNEKLKVSVEKEIQNIEQKIKKLEESINNYDEKIKGLESKCSSWKKVKKIANVLERYKKLKKKTKDNLKEVDLLNLNRLLNVYNKTISNYINNEKNMLDQIDKYKLNKETEKAEKENLNKKIENDNMFLKQLKKTISKLEENLNNQKLRLTKLINQERERERER